MCMAHGLLCSVSTWLTTVSGLSVWQKEKNMAIGSDRFRYIRGCSWCVCAWHNTNPLPAMARGARYSWFVAYYLGFRVMRMASGGVDGAE